MDDLKINFKSSWIIQDKDKNTEFIRNKQTVANKSKKVKNEPQKRFNDLINQAHQSGYSNVNLDEIATIKEISDANYLLSRYYNKFSDQYKLDKYDYAISGIIGTVAALMDYFLVTKVDGKKSCQVNWNQELRIFGTSYYQRKKYEI